jgi:transcriptional regulator with XRE-family HTH domain
MTQEEIAEKLGVSRRSVETYISEAPTSLGVQNAVESLEIEVRYVAAQKLRDQLQAAGERAASAETPVKVWRGPSGNLCVKDERDPATEELTGRYIIPAGFEMGADEKARYFGRTEVREILDLLTDIVGAKAADRQEIELSGEVETDFSLSDDDRAALDERFGDSEK